ncbi:hypothetical protein [Streptomyces lienomycini]|uniref:Uncharacterized protein n=1 Tax=Streptomyces lienomycini TaxID=284035 RepID=A0ABV9X4L9_9ACTN|nr:hypothetical protein [Streptomyces lienomycini]
MATHLAHGDPDFRISLWQRVREFAVPPSMIETATTRRRAGDWAGACAAAAVDVDLDPRSVARTHGHAVASRLRADLRHLAPDLLRWHMPRIAPDGLLRPGLTLTLARYDTAGHDGARPLHLVVRTPPAWADGGQRISLALWDGTGRHAGTARHPHPRPSRRFRLDLHRHLWDARRTGELRVRSGADLPPPADAPAAPADPAAESEPERHCAVDRWAAEAGILLRAEDRTAPGTGTRTGTAEGTGTSTVVVRVGAGQRLALELDTGPDGVPRSAPRIAALPTGGSSCALPVLPDAATWVLPDLELVRAGAVEAGRLHPLVAPALVPGRVPAAPPSTAGPVAGPRIVDCRGARHRIGLVDGALAALDHDPAEIRREELLAALTGTPLPCFRAIDDAHRRPECLPGIRERLRHGDTAGALAVVESLLGPAARLRDGALRDDLEAAALRRVAHGMYRAGLDEPAAGRACPDRHRPRTGRSRPRHALFD